MENAFANNSIAFTFGVVTGAFIVLLISIIVFIITNKIRYNIQRNKEIVGKTVSGLMRKINQIFIAYRLGDISFRQMELESRDIISQIDEEVSDNTELLNNSYISVIQQYIDEKNETLIAIKEDMHHYSAHTADTAEESPATQDAVDPEKNQQVSSLAADFSSTREEDPVPENENKILESFESERDTTQTEAFSEKESHKESDPETESDTDLFEDMRKSLQDEESGPNDSIEDFSADTFDPAEQTESEEPSLNSKHPHIEEDDFSFAIDKAFELDRGNDAQSKDAETSSETDVGDDFSFGENTMEFDRDSLMASGDTLQDERPEEMGSTHSLDDSKSPFEVDLDSEDSAFDDISLGSSGDLGNIDVEATQEFNLNDIMSQAGSDDDDDDDSDMVSGDDVANKLDDLFK
ncbi:MAG: hypothetical protein ACQEQ4_08835 [Fibrobacterota bacterium]